MCLLDLHFCFLSGDNSQILKNLLPGNKRFQVAPENSKCPQMPPIGQVNSVTRALGNCIIHMTPAIAPQEAIQITSQLRHLPYEIV